ncbi:hypothetical protein [Streptomyces sp. CB01580]|uniref:hypothetical protein n=1 Tax=Streptomyces sp. CB01580 TaxID=1703933 RepID=UPI001301566D|nr:hypothetical protein [Streptomyces sp. CB01580]
MSSSRYACAREMPDSTVRYAAHDFCVEFSVLGLKRALRSARAGAQAAARCG